MNSTLFKAATLLGVAGMGGLAGAVVTERTPEAPAAAAPAAVAAPPVEVRTEVVHRTVRIVRHVKAKPPKPAPAVAAPAPAVQPAVQPAVNRAVVATPATSAPKRLVTHTSGSKAGGEREHENEGGGDD